MRPAACLLLFAVLAAEEEDGYAQGRAGFGALLVAPPIGVLARHDLLPGEGALVLWVRPGSTASALGLEPGDLVQTLSGNPVASRRDVREVLHTVEPGDRAVVEIRRHDGGADRLVGAFKERQPRRGWGPPPWARPSGEGSRSASPGEGRGPGSGPVGFPGWGDPARSAEAQYEQLYLARQGLADLARLLAERRRPPPRAAWYLQISTPEPTP